MKRRISDREEYLEKETKHLRVQLARLRANPPEIPLTACDHSCIVAAATGMATNGGCRCDERKLRIAVQYWRSVAQHRLAVIDQMRDPFEPSGSEVPR